MLSNSLRPHGLKPAKLLCPWNSPGMNTGVGYHALFQWIFPTQRLKLGLSHCRWILYHLSHQGSPNLPINTYPVLFSAFHFQVREQGKSCRDGAQLAWTDVGKPVSARPHTHSTCPTTNSHPGTTLSHSTRGCFTKSQSLPSLTYNSIIYFPGIPN